MNRLGAILEDEEEKWLIYEFLMQQKRMLHSQIDIIMKAKSNTSDKSFGTERFSITKTDSPLLTF